MTNDSDFELETAKTSKPRKTPQKKPLKKPLKAVDVSQIQTDFQLEGRPFELLENCPGKL